MPGWRTGGRIVAILGVLAAAACTWPPFGTPTLQGWSATDRTNWYEASQGSRMIPRAWLDALEQPGSDQPFLADGHIAGFRYMPRVTSVGLPLGFAVDRQDDSRFVLTRLRWRANQPDTEDWVGMNCAACHTGHVAYGGDTIRIEGGQALADFQGFIDSLNLAVAQTAQDPARFDRFAKRVLAAEDSPANRALLRDAVGRWTAWNGRQLAANATTLRYGYGRVDAFGHIFNKVAQLLDASAPGSPADAPVSYPFLWNIDRLPRVQYNAIATNGPRIGEGEGAVDIGAAGRNAGEVIGVFAELVPQLSSSAGGYATSLNLRNQVALEQQLMRLEAPRWPAQFPAIDAALAARGAPLYAARCASCHLPATADAVRSEIPARISTFLDASKDASTGDTTRNSPPGTDPAMACNAATVTASSGVARGRPGNFIDGDPLPATAPVAQLLKHVVAGALLDQGFQVGGDLLLQSWFGFPQIPVLVRTRPRRPAPAALAAPLPIDAAPAAPVVDPARAARVAACLTTVNPLLGYKSRPLDGIWATAPYLHNGSVPNLYEILLPPAQRSATFSLGTFEYDPVRVGYRTEPAAPGNGFTFRARDAAGRPIPGNDNAGHDYGNASLSEADRLAILEYLKTL